MNKTFLLMLCAAFLIAGCDKPSNPQEDNFAASRLPNGSRKLTQLGNNWITFKLNVAGKDRTFLYHGKSLGYNTGVETITELN